MAVLNITGPELQELIRQVANDEIEIAEAWDFLGSKGDGYAFLAGAIVSDDTENMDVIARAFYEMVRSLWGNTGAGEELGVWGGEVFFGVGKEHLTNYLEFLDEHEVENGYVLPTTKDIEASYKAALAEYGLLPDTAIDAHFSVIDYFLGDGNGEPPNDISLGK